ncbi:hypothetical protein NPIL_631711, partial [Nephila pilipes]
SAQCQTLARINKQGSSTSLSLSWQEAKRIITRLSDKGNSHYPEETCLTPTADLMQYSGK